MEAGASMTRTFPSRHLGTRMESGHLWQRLYSVVDVNVETHCMRLSVVSTFSLRAAVSRRMQCVSTKILKFINANLVHWQPLFFTGAVVYCNTPRQAWFEISRRYIRLDFKDKNPTAFVFPP